jgi:hypothetical protein
VPPNGFDRLKNIYFSVLDHLLDASVGGAIHSPSRLAIPKERRGDVKKTIFHDNPRTLQMKNDLSAPVSLILI